MIEPIKNFIEALRKKPQVSKFDETETKQGMILPLLHLLGWDVWDPDEVKSEYPVERKKAPEGGKVDYCLRIRGNSEVFLEVKRPGEDLEKHQEQLLDYSFREGADIAVLSNGIFWWFYLPRQRIHWKERKFYAIDIFQQDTGEIAEKFTQLLSRNHVQSGEALQNAKFIYEQLDRKKKISETLPKAWNKIITGGDSKLLDLVADTTESLCGFRPEIEDIKDMIVNFKEKLLLPEAYELKEKPTTSKGRKKPVDLRRMRKATRVLSVKVVDDKLEVFFPEDGANKSWHLPSKTDKEGIRKVLNEALTFGEQNEASKGQLKAIWKALTQAGYYLTGPRRLKE
jgi:hypothetical protein